MTFTAITNYDRLDKFVIDRITIGVDKITFAVLYGNYAIRLELDAIKKDQPARDQDKILDGRLQALKQQRKIRYDGKNGWVLV